MHHHYQPSQAESFLGATSTAVPTILDPTIGCMAVAASSTTATTSVTGGIGALGGLGGPLLRTNHPPSLFTNHIISQQQQLQHNSITVPMTAQPPAGRHSTTAASNSLLNRQIQPPFVENCKDQSQSGIVLSMSQNKYRCIYEICMYEMYCVTRWISDEFIRLQ